MPSNLRTYTIRGRKIRLHRECVKGWKADRAAGLIYGPYRRPDGGMFLTAEEYSLAMNACPYCGWAEPIKPPVRATLKAIRALGLTAGYHEGEYRVNLPKPEGTEGSAYYTDDAEDALDTARRMAADAKMRKEVVLFSLEQRISARLPAIEQCIQAIIPCVEQYCVGRPDTKWLEAKIQAAIVACIREVMS